MKTRMVLIAAAVLLFACAGFAQQGFSVFLYNDGVQLRASSPTACDGGEPLPDGTPIEIRWDQNNSGAFDPADPLAPLCALPPDCPGGPAGTVNYNTFAINSAEQGLLPGQFAVGVNFTSVGSMNPQRFWLVIRCADGTPHYVSQTLVFSAGPQEVDVLEWTCLPCTTVLPCNPSPDVTIRATGSNHHWLISECLHLCPQGAPVVVHICSPDGIALDPTKTPVSFWSPGCQNPENCFEPNCPPTAADLLGPVYNPATGCWDYQVVLAPGAPEGCICFTFDMFLAVGFNNDFQAVASDGAVNLTWSTSSEVSMARYDIVRNGDKVGEVSAANAAHTYNFVDESAVNGTTYSYSLKAVDMNGSVTDLATVEGITPSFGAAVITEYALHQNFPNPFNPTTEITFDVVDRNLVTLKIFNAAGQEVATVANGEFESGRHIVSFNAANLTSGLYFYTVKIGNEFSATKKMLLVK